MLLVVLGISLLLSSVGANYAALVYRAFAVERSLLTVLGERSARASAVTELLKRAAAGEHLSRFILEGDATVLTSHGPRLVALGRDLPRIVSERAGLNSERYPSWSALLQSLPRLDCAEPAQPVGSAHAPVSRGRSSVSCATPLPVIGAGFVTGNIDLESVTLGGDSEVVLAARGDIRVGSVQIECDEVSAVSIIATGDVEIDALVPCQTNPVELIIHSSGGSVTIGGLGIPDPSAALCVGTAPSPLRVGAQSALGTRIAPFSPLPPGFLGCPLRRSASFWRRIKLVGEVS